MSLGPVLNREGWASESNWGIAVLSTASINPSTCCCRHSRRSARYNELSARSWIIFLLFSCLFSCFRRYLWARDLQLSVPGQKSGCILQLTICSIFSFSVEQSFSHFFCKCSRKYLHKFSLFSEIMPHGIVVTNPYTLSLATLHSMPEN